MQQARMDEGYLADQEVGILYGNDSSAKAVIESVDLARQKKDNTLIGSGYIFQSMNSTVTMNLATIFKLKGINLTVSAACASSSHAIGLGYLLIKSGIQDCIICGGAQEINEFVMGSFDGISAFSVRDRDGLVPSGGAATVIIESLESARRRGAPILAEITGYGFSSNGGHIIQPNVEGPARSLTKAIRDAGIRVEEIDYLNAHATSTPLGDSCEAQAIHEVFGTHRVPVSSTKSMTGHECWMAGASEVVYSMLMMQNSFVAPNINFQTPDEDSARLNIAAKTLEKKIDTFLTNSFGFGGTNSTLIVTRFKN
jgi:3-oxoacyl-[acyl-carrier-protein] synthase-1